MKFMESYNLLSFMEEQRKTLRDAGQTPESNADLRVMDELYNKMLLLKQYAEESYYERIRILYPWYTDHGEKHIAQVERMVAQLLVNYKLNLHPFEIFILHIAIYYHDTGMIESRDKHGEAVRDVLTKLSMYMPNRDFERAVYRIAAAHTGSFDKVENLSTHEPLSYYNVSARINARALASLLRFADEVSETVARIDTFFLENDKVPTDQRIFWEYANCIKFSTPDLQSRAIDVDVRIEKEVCFKNFSRIRKNGTKETLQFFDFFIERIKKMDGERKNCCAYFRDMVAIDSIRISVEIIDCNGERAVDLSPNTIILREITNLDSALSSMKNALRSLIP